MPMENLPFDAFDKAHAAMWRQTMYQFDEDKVKIEELTKAFIDTSFKKLRSAEGESNKNLTAYSTSSYCWKIWGNYHIQVYLSFIQHKKLTSHT